MATKAATASATVSAVTLESAFALESAAATAAAEATAPGLTFFSLTYPQGAPLQIRLVQAVNCCLTFVVVRHLDKAEAP